MSGHLEESAAVAPATQTKETYGIVGEFETPESLLKAVREARRRGYRKMEAFSPFPIHGIDEAMGERRSKLGFIVLGCGITGLVSALLLQWWTGAVSYPLVIGGKPLFAFEFSMPVTFELTVLFAAIGAVLGMILLNGLPRLHHPVFHYSNYAGATDDRFLLAVEAADPKFHIEDAEQILRWAGAIRTEVVEA